MTQPLNIISIITSPQLSDLDGGATAFPNQGLATFPNKGSMAFWYNLETSGLRSESSLHGACPSLYGIKWGKYSSTYYIIYIILNREERKYISFPSNALG